MSARRRRARPAARSRAPRRNPSLEYLDNRTEAEFARRGLTPWDLLTPEQAVAVDFALSRGVSARATLLPDFDAGELPQLMFVRVRDPEAQVALARVGAVSPHGLSSLWLPLRWPDAPRPNPIYLHPDARNQFERGVYTYDRLLTREQQVALDRADELGATIQVYGWSDPTQPVDFDASGTEAQLAPLVKAGFHRPTPRFYGDHRAQLRTRLRFGADGVPLPRENPRHNPGDAHDDAALEVTRAWPAWMQVEADRLLAEGASPNQVLTAAGEAIAQQVQRWVPAAELEIGEYSFVWRRDGSLLLDQELLEPEERARFSLRVQLDPANALGDLGIRTEVRGEIRGQARRSERLRGALRENVRVALAEYFSAACRGPSPRPNPTRRAAAPGTFWRAWPQWLQVGVDAALARGASLDDAVQQVGRALHEHLDRATGDVLDRWDVGIGWSDGHVVATSAIDTPYVPPRRGFPVRTTRAAFTVRFYVERWQDFRLTWFDAHARRLAEKHGLERDLNWLVGRALREFFAPDDEAQMLRVVFGRWLPNQAGEV